MRTVALLLGCTLALAAQAQSSSREIWKWVDKDGVTQYSDQPRAGATRVEIAGVTPPPSASVTRTGPVRPVPPTTTKPTVPVEYQLIEILQPMDGESFFGSDTAVPVRVRLEPELGPTDSVRLYVDGALVQGYPPDNLEYSLVGLDRGAHSMTVVVADQFNKELLRSEPRVFHVRLPSVIDSPNVGPNLKPKPPQPTPRPPQPTPKSG
jgi:hypothetical protein